MTQASVIKLYKITDNGNCFYTVTCDTPGSISTVPDCDSTDPYITLVIKDSPFHNVTAKFFNTKFDRHVRILTAVGNNWSDVQSNAFSNFKNVLYMDLSENQIKNISKAFIGLAQMDSLNLSRNLLEVIKPEVFILNKKNRLFLLDLSYNLLTYLPEDLFVNIYNLRKLYLQGNKLKLLGDQFSTNLKNLNSLNLCCSNFTELNITLKNFKSLRELDLSYNNLKEIDVSEVFSLETINLSHNNISEFRFDYFEQFPNLEELDLSYNKLKKIYGSNSIQNDNEMKPEIRIYLNNNNISHIDQSFLNTFNKIGLLDLGYNEITKFKFRRYTQLEDYREYFFDQNK